MKRVTNKEISVSDLRPQAGSLAAALGMGIDRSTKAAPVRQRKAMSLPSIETKKKKSLADAVMENIASSFDEGSELDNVGGLILIAIVIGIVFAVTSKSDSSTATSTDDVAVAEEKATIRSN